MEKYNGDIINPEYVELILSEVKHSNSPYIDISETEDAYDYLTQEARPNDARILVEYALQLHPDSIELLLLSARICIDNNELKKAANILATIPSSATENPDYYISYGWLELKKKNMPKAIEYFDQACQIDEDMSYEIGLNLNQFGKHKEAKRFLIPYVKEYPNDAEALFELAYAYEKTNMINEARTTYETLVDKNPFYPTAWYNLGIIYSNESQFDKALNAYTTATTIAPEYAEPYFNMGNAYMNLAQYNKALENYIEYASLTISNAKIDSSVMQYIGECWWELGNFDLARRFYKKAISNIRSKSPNNDTLYYGYALCCIELNDNKEAIRVLTKLIGTNACVSEYYFARAQAECNSLDKTGAYCDIIDGISLSPNNVLAWHEAMRLYISIYSVKSIEYFLKEHKQYKSYPAFQFITFVVQYCFMHKYKTALKTLEQVAQNNKDVIYDAAEEDSIRHLLSDPYIEQMLQKYKIQLSESQH